jgi:uncharacterized protein YbjT (DUF2867 family)
MHIQNAQYAWQIKEVSDMILCVGATGLLGGTVVEELAKRNWAVRCLVRENSDTSKLQQKGIDLVYGDVRDRASIAQAVEGVETVISTFATNMAKDKRVSSLWQTDYEGNLSLIRLAKEAGVKKFVFVSYWGLAKFADFEHGKIKKAVEGLLEVSGLDYTILRVTSLATDLSLTLGNILKKKSRAPVFMKKNEVVRPILLEDLAWCIADAVVNSQASRRIIEAAGEEKYTFLELQELYCHAIGKKIRFIFVPPQLALFVASCVDFATRNQYNARGLVSAFTGGSTCDITDMRAVFRIKQGSFARHLEDFFRTGSVLPQVPEALPHKNENASG